MRILQYNMETINKITSQEFFQKLREKAAQAKAEGRVKALPTQHIEFINRLRERAKANGKVGVAPISNPMADMLKKLKARQAELNANKEE